MESIDELLQKNRVLQEELNGFLSFIDNIQTKNDEAWNLSEALILTRQQARNKSARPSRACVNLNGPDLRVSGGAQLTSSLWCHDCHSPSLSEDSTIAAEILARVPPCFKSSFCWNAKEIQSLCCGVLSIVQQKLMECVFRGVSVEQEDEMEMLRHGIEECRRMRLDSNIAIGIANELIHEDWQTIANRFLQKRTAAECRIQWICFVRPDRNQRPFSTNEATELKSIAQTQKCANWEDIAKELGTGRHPAECLRFYRQHFDCGNRKWSQEEDLQISTAWENGGLDSLKVLNITLGRDIRSVVARSRQLQQRHQFKTGKWHKQEDLKLLKSVLHHGMNWESVAKDVRHRSPAQCRERFVYSLEPSLHRDKGTRWTQEDTEELKVLVEKQLQQFGKVKWALLAKSFRGVSPRDLLNKWNFMMEQNATRQ